MFRNRGLPNSGLSPTILLLCENLHCYLSSTVIYADYHVLTVRNIRFRCSATLFLNLYFLWASKYQETDLN